MPAKDIHGAPWNFRRHDEHQVETLAGSLEDLGFLDPLDVFEAEDGTLTLFDGHARQALIEVTIGPDTLVPCSITDLSEREAQRAMLMKDPVAALAGTDNVALTALARQVDAQNESLYELVESMRRDQVPFQPNVDPSVAPVSAPTEAAIAQVQQALQDKMTQGRDLVTVTCPACHGQFGIDGP